MSLKRSVLLAASGLIVAAAATTVASGRIGLPSVGGGEPAIGAAQLTAAIAPAPAQDGAAETALAANLRQSLPDFPDLPTPALTPQANIVRVVARATSANDVAVPDLSAVTREYDAYGVACAEPTLKLVKLRTAMLGLSLSAPCHAGEVVRVSHASLTFAARLSATGTYATTIPALGTAGAVEVTMERGIRLEQVIPVPDIGTVVRIALQLRGQDGLHLNALANGAAFDAPGLIAPATPGHPSLGRGGYLTRLGDPTLDDPLLAEVLTLPASADAARPMLVVEVGAANCARDLLVTVATAEGRAVPRTGAVSFSMPDCDAAGQRLALDASTFLTRQLAANSN
ncbi:hypothetical protein OU426_07615 [Frigidibacter sp. RF13]|uniref:hypothetical protein n=1 Tax=Frigidibacter sp. RF13 TaxID=2997340 RepID=UPI00226F8EF1|nr:hypothetical protein [Frigidibacter sp. RF13]MCY1126714.1 hypothetical protein [Frigidibacter sp. RF13]